MTGGRWIDANLPPASRVAINDAGALAYFGNRPVIDLIGLVSRGPTGRPWGGAPRRHARWRVC